jgi:2-polyprenyl-6-methoxyphenol hydroxylase-like FAD-dependent oxidoreductase
MKIAICGAGIAGATLAFWLRRAGFEPFLIERAPALRKGGYIMDFWGLGYTVAERMGILDTVRARGYQLERLQMVGADGRPVGGFPVAALRKLTHDRFTSVPRGDLAAEIFAALDGRVEILLGDTIAHVEENGAGVALTLESGGVRQADILVGADGLNSRVRRLAFAPDSACRKDLGYRFAVFSLPGYRPRADSAYVLHAAPGRQIGRFSLREDRTLFLFAYRSPSSMPPPRDDAEAREQLKAVFAGMGWETPAILGRLDEAQDFYADDVAQIRLPSWRKGKVALIGDAGAAVSFMAGEGGGLAMAEAYVLAGEIARDPAAAFAAYENRMFGFLKQKQEAAEKFAATFVPETQFALWLRNQASRLTFLPGMANLMFGATVRDDFDLPDYG